MQPWPYKEEPEISKVGWRTIVRKVFTQPDGRDAEYYTFNGPKSRAGAVIALTPDNKVVVAEQFRPGPEMILQELPGGGIDSGEDPQVGVMRELREETGYISDEVEFLGNVFKDSYTNTTWYFYLARNCHKPHEQSLDDGEFVTIKEIEIADLFENARNGRMTDVSAVFLAYETLKSIQDMKQ